MQTILRSKFFSWYIKTGEASSDMLLISIRFWRRECWHFPFRQQFFIPAIWKKWKTRWWWEHFSSYWKATSDEGLSVSPHNCPYTSVKTHRFQQEEVIFPRCCGLLLPSFELSATEREKPLESRTVSETSSCFVTNTAAATGSCLPIPLS